MVSFLVFMFCRLVFYGIYKVNMLSSKYPMAGAGQELFVTNSSESWSPDHNVDNALVLYSR